MHKIWQENLADYMNSAKMTDTLDWVENREKNETVFPPKELRFSAFNEDPKNIKVVVIGQDPYINDGEAHGYCFSVMPGMPIPPSLRNIYKEIEAEGFGVSNRKNGYLKKWVDQGVFLINTHLSVKKGESLSHKDAGWESFTSHAIEKLQEIKKNEPLVFMLWGTQAKQKRDLIYHNNTTKVIETSHPAPLGFFKGFNGSGCFKKCNQFLESHGESGIDWVIE